MCLHALCPLEYWRRWRRILGASLLAAWCGVAGEVGAAEVEIQVAPRGADEISELSPAVLPRELLVDPSAAAAFDEVSRKWVISVRPLQSFVTDMSLELKKNDNKGFPRPPLRISLPYRDAVIQVVIPLAAEPDGARVRAAYRGDIPAVDSRDYLTDFLQASILIDFLTQGAASEAVEPTPALARALVVYAESMDWLLSATEWFGVPASVLDRAEMIRNILAAAAADSRLSEQIHVGRVGRAHELVKRAEHRLYLRISRALAELPPWRCNESFPILYSFYLHLQQLPREQYVRIRTATRFTRTHILLQSTSCFRQLLTIDPGVRYARPEVITGPFGGRSAEMVATDLKQNLEFELRLRRIESGDAQNAGRGCDGSGVAEAEERKICRDLAYLDELVSMLIEENTNAENLQ